MLGLNRASQYAGWWSDSSPSVLMESTSALQYEVYQEPVFSMNLGQTPVLGGEIDLTGYTSLSGYGNGKYTLMFNYRPDYSNTSYPNGEYLGNIGRMQVVDYSESKNWFLYCTAGTGYDTPVNLSIGYGTPDWGLSMNLPGSYLDWMGRWYYIVITVSPNYGDFTDWSDPSGSTGTSYCRAMIYDQETGEVIFQQDRKVTDTTNPDVALLSNPLLVDDPYTATIDCFDIRLFASGSISILESLISNFWCSYGTMFDPLSIDQSTTAWRTTRPDEVIGSAQAWTNWQFTDSIVEGTTPNREYWVTASGDDLYSETDNKGIARQIFSGWVETDIYDPTNVWDDVVVYDIIPKDRNI